MSKFKNVKYLLAQIQPRYWEDADVNGNEDDEDGTNIPLKNGNLWEITIEIESGKILNWPANTTASVHYKVCDQGNYYLLDKEFNILFSREDNYVPDVLAPCGQGYGDYVILDIDENGIISNWNNDDDFQYYLEQDFNE